MSLRATSSTTVVERKGWPVTRLRYVATVNPRASELDELDRQTVVTFLPMEAVGDDGSLDLSRERTLTQVEGSYSYFRDGDVVIAKVTPCFENGKTALMRGLRNGIGFGSSELTTVRPTDVLDAGYLSYLVRADFLRQAGIASMYGAGGLKRVPDDFFRDLPIPVPTISQQRAVTLFLDRETAKLDTLIAKQEHLVELLQEKRQAVISHAVTKGLNQNAPMNDSGAEWLGQVPRHWNVTILKRLATLHRGFDLTESERLEGPYPVVTSGGVVGTHVAFMAKAPGVVTGRYGSTGTFFYVNDDYWPHNTSLFVSDFHGNHPRYVWYALQTVDFRGYSNKAAVPGIDRNDLHTIEVVVPPLTEQVAVARFLDEQVQEIEHLSTRTHLFIALVKEHRSALISSAVTGKIDVRAEAAVAVSEQLLTA